LWNTCTQTYLGLTQMTFKQTTRQQRRQQQQTKLYTDKISLKRITNKTYIRSNDATWHLSIYFRLLKTTAIRQRKNFQKFKNQRVWGTEVPQWGQGQCLTFSHKKFLDFMNTGADFGQYFCANANQILLIQWGGVEPPNLSCGYASASGTWIGHSTTVQIDVCFVRCRLFPWPT